MPPTDRRIGLRAARSVRAVPMKIGGLAANRLSLVAVCTRCRVGRRLADQSGSRPLEALVRVGVARSRRSTGDDDAGMTPPGPDGPGAPYPRPSYRRSV